MSEPGPSRLLVLLLSTDFVFILLHIANITLGKSSSLLDIGASGSYVETYQFVKLYWVIVLLLLVLRSTRCLGYVSWMVVFAFLLLNDALGLHRIAGRSLAVKFSSFESYGISLEARHFGEWAVLAIAGAFLVAILTWAYLRSSHTFRKVSNDMLVFMVALVFFGGVVDLFAAIDLGSATNYALRTIEDAGEMVVVSLVVWYGFLLALRDGKPELFLHDVLCRFRSRRGP